MPKVWIEAALNGPWSRRFQPGIPDTVETIVAEGVACARAGATIIHAHAYDGGGPQTHDWQVYARIIEGIRNQVDVPVYPSYPAFMTDGDAALADISARYTHIEALVERGLLEFALVDPGSVNFTLTNTTLAAKPAGTYLNPEDQVRYVLDFAARHGLHRISRSTSPASCVPARCWPARPAPGLRSTVSCSATRSRSAFRQSPMRYRPIWRCWRRKRPARPG